MTHAVIINSPADALAEIKKLLKSKDTKGHYDVDIGKLPPLEIYLKGDKFDNSITTSVMHGLIKLQDAVYRSYALLKYGHTNLTRLKDYEKQALELKVVVKSGSSELEVDTQNLAEKFIELMGKMESKHILIAVCVTIVALFGYGVTSLYADYKTEQITANKEIEAEQEKTKQLLGMQENTIKAMEKGAEIAKPVSPTSSASATTTTEKTKVENISETKEHEEYFKLIQPPSKEVQQILTEVRLKEPKAQAVADIMDDGILKLIKSTENADLVRFNNFFEASGTVARKIAEKPRSTSKEITFNDEFRVLDFDSARTDKRRVKLRQFTDDKPLDFTAEFTDTSIGKAKMDKIMLAIRGYHPIELGITAKVLHDKVHSAVITQVREVNTTHSFKDDDEENT